MSRAMMTTLAWRISVQQVIPLAFEKNALKNYLISKLKILLLRCQNRKQSVTQRLSDQFDVSTFRYSRPPPISLTTIALMKTCSMPLQRSKTP